MVCGESSINDVAGPPHCSSDGVTPRYMADGTAAATVTAGKEQEDPKAQLAREICSISSIFSSCTHRRWSPAAAEKRASFVDWYLILRVDENVGIDVIRRQYRQFALQLHPDKNSHPKADVAFKLISEAYGCLSDRAKRQVFNSERKDNYCNECHWKNQPNLHKNPQHSPQHQSTTPAHQARPRRHLRAVLEEVQERLRGECWVIEKCLRATQASQAGIPLFDPSDCALFPDYPHQRPPLPPRPQEYKRFHVSACRSFRRGTESPLFEINSDYI